MIPNPAFSLTTIRGDEAFRARANPAPPARRRGRRGLLHASPNRPGSESIHAGVWASTGPSLTGSLGSDGGDHAAGLGSVDEDLRNIRRQSVWSDMLIARAPPRIVAQANPRSARRRSGRRLKELARRTPDSERQSVHHTGCAGRCTASRRPASSRRPSATPTERCRRTPGQSKCSHRHMLWHRVTRHPLCRDRSSGIQRPRSRSPDR